MAEQHTAHLSDINYLMERYQPDELAAYIAARSQWRQEIIGHDFSLEPNLQEGLNRVNQLKQDFEELDPEIKKHFKNHVEWLKFIDNPANQEKMIKMGLMTKREIEKHTSEPNNELNDEKNAGVKTNKKEKTQDSWKLSRVKWGAYAPLTFLMALFKLAFLTIEEA